MWRGILIFVKIIRDLTLAVLRFTRTKPVVSALAFRYTSQGFTPFSNAITVVILVLSILTILTANRLQGKSLPRMKASDNA